MTSTEMSSKDTVRHRKDKCTEDQSCVKENGSPPGHIKDLEKWKQQMEVVKAELMENMGNQMKHLLDKAVADALQLYTKKEEISPLKKEHNRSQESGREKIFIQRASLLDDLMEVEHFRTIYHMFVAALCVFFISTVAVNFIDQGRLVLELDLLFYSFGQLGTVTWSWIFLFGFTLFVPYATVHYWGSLYPKSKHPYLMSVCLASIYGICNICAMGVFPIYIVLHYKLPPASSFIVTLEQVRLLMKSHSFLRETVESVVQKKRNPEQLPKLSSYLYFLFCPCLIYRDSYPRTPYIRWSYVAKNFAQFLACVFFIYFVLVTLCIPVFTNMSKEPLSMRTLVLSIFHSTLPGMFILLITFFAFLHCC
uniref:Sterol O-acyltransferase 2 n=1 Tax=Leptobrachium leishanense TaxID=445787 RepID=A0A8C5PCA6_9ANUR